MKSNHCLFIYNCRFSMKQGSYSQEKSGGKGNFQESQGKSGKISETEITFFVVCRNLYFPD